MEIAIPVERTLTELDHVRPPRLLPRPGAGAARDGVRETAAASAARDASADYEAARDEWSLADVEKEHIRRVLARHKGNISRAALEAGIDRNYIHRLVKKYNLDVDRG